MGNSSREKVEGTVPELVCWQFHWPGLIEHIYVCASDTFQWIWMGCKKSSMHVERYLDITFRILAYLLSWCLIWSQSSQNYFQEVSTTEKHL